MHKHQTQNFWRNNSFDVALVEKHAGIVNLSICQSQILKSYKEGMDRNDTKNENIKA